MSSSKLSTLLPLKYSSSFHDNIDCLYKYFQDEIMDQKTRKRLFGEFIFIDCNRWTKHKNDLFWHIISLHKNERFNILPCNNCISYSLCPDDNCINMNEKITLNSGENRNICLYRGVRIVWINDIIELANNGDPDIMIWKEDIKDKKYNKKVYIRYKKNNIDYAVVFEERYRRDGKIRDYFLITAFPTFYINKKKTFDKSYIEYMKKTNLIQK